ncbi:hypothetical protein, conserved [Babesia ovata]|uniref:Extracellular matrix-binding ebh n=1 Tax=Babesia ovata TaxID=189622 RepID=A0A2H6KJ15_9APIC|nr:uncharacterized protein BOVATA_044690 [Babesia ovata]GBE62976.1 hypothetical protein, conserved [Babesia ovata]
MVTWIEAADAAVKAAKEKAEDVHGRLDHNKNDASGTVIGQGIGKIEEAKDKVKQVDKKLSQHIDELGTWKSAAHSVLSTAVEKAEEVHGKLDPNQKDDKHPIGHNIEKIHTAKTELDRANSQLKTQVASLHSWISTAEGSAKRPSRKRRRLIKIVDANERIKNVNNSLNGVHGNLGAWNQQARTVLAGAITNAQHVHDHLVDSDINKPLGAQIKNINDANTLIKNANDLLKTDVANLGKWNKTAREVITNAEKKCDLILGKVKTDKSGQKGPIYMQAEKLQKDGNRLLKAATAAKEEVGNLVTDALEAVVKMDGDLKRDLKEVKEKIKSGINQVITSLGVKELDAKVKDDLGTLRQKIEGLKNNMDDDSKPNELVKQALENLAEEKQTLEKVTHKDTGSIKREMDKLDNNFKTAIQNPLDTKVKEVETAIGTLGGKFSLNGDKMLEKIFGHVKGEVGKIKGKPGQKGSWENNGGQGLDGIQSKVQSYANAFSGDDGGKFNIIVKGWIEETILKHNGAVRKMLDKKFAYDESEKDVFTNVADAFKEQLKSESTEAGIKVVHGNNGASGNSQKIQGYVNAVKDGCDAFAQKLDDKLRNGNGFSGIFDAVKQQLKDNHFSAKQCICESVGCTNCNGQGSVHKQDCKEKAFIAAILCTLTAVSRQVGNELKSVLLDPPNGNNIASILDKITPIAAMLSTQLTQATERSGQSNNESPAQAVDSRLGEVRDFVNGKNGDNLNKIFKENVINTLTEKVRQLPGAVGAFDQEAQNQIKAAAKTAIERAAGEISKDNVDASKIVLGNGLMNGFHTQFTTIKDSLDSELRKQVDKHIGEDDGQPGGKITELKTTMFNNYNNHVEQESVKTFESSNNPESLTGQLPVAINSISSDGLQKLTELIDDSPSGGTDPKKITKQTFEEPVKAINKELEEIRKLVEKEGTPQGTDEGVKDLLAKLSKGLEKEKLSDKVDKGLEEIKTKIDELHKNQFKSGPQAIGGAVSAIQGELAKLRKVLQNITGYDVIETLKDLKDKGLANEAGWRKFSDRNTLAGLGRIQERLKYQNGILPDKTQIISDAIDRIQWELKLLGVKLDHPVRFDDVLDNLKWLKRKIGKDNPFKGNLQHIYNQINFLQNWEFPTQWTTIHRANEAIKEELKGQMSTLGSDVITKLTNLMTKGMSEQASWQGTKGLENIQNDLQRQQALLNKQPGAIGSGVDLITTELDDLRSELLGEEGENAEKRGVIKNMDFMIKQIGTIDDDKDSLKKIKKEIEELNRDTVPDINKFLGELCAKIASEAGSVDWQLGLFKENNIDKDLAKIKTQIDTLRIDDLHKAIEACDQFLTNADYIKWEKVENIERFVDSEIEKAIAELSKQARRDYVESAKDALKHFAAKVAEELGELPGEINRDLFAGFKGLMKQMEGERSENINRLRNVQSRMLRALSSAFQNFFAPLDEYVSSEIRREHREREGDKSPLLPPSEERYATKLNYVYTALNNLLTHITGAQRYGHEVRGLLDALDKALAGLRPECFARPSTAVIDGVTDGLSAFAAELRNAYISAYSGAALTGDLVSSEAVTAAEASGGRKAVSERSVTVLTPYGENLCKVLLSIVPILDSSFAVLKHNCRSLAGQRLDKSTDLGRLLGEMGYNVPDGGQRSGELNGHVTGKVIAMLLVGDHSRVFNSDRDTKTALGILLECLHDYYKACHYATCSATRSPCNVYEMLVWLTGLPHNCVYQRLRKSAKLCHDEQIRESPYASTIPAEALVAALDRLTADCPSLLTRVLGFGDAATTYACDIHSNALGLHYPQDGENCLHLLLHMLRRLLPALRYLFTQCSLPAHHGGWAECRYGKGVPPYTWQCAPPLTALPNPHPECSDKSPLMSYLNDCLPGHLPHQLVSVGCEPQCNTCPSAPNGTPCLTPLGFRGFSGSTKTGKEICEVLTKFFAHRHLSSLLSLCPRPPATLAEHIGFALSLVNDWHDGNIAAKNGLQTALEASATDLSLRLYDRPFELTAALAAAYGSDSAKHGGCKHPHLMHLAGTDVCTRHQASPFLQSLCHDVYNHLAHRHSGLYLSWAVYLPWNFYDLLLCCSICRDLADMAVIMKKAPVTRAATESLIRGHLPPAAAAPPSSPAGASCLRCTSTWIEAADAAVNAAKEKAEDVHRRLDHNKKDQHGGTTIGQNIENIKQAKDKVKQVDGQLKRIHSDLGNWKNAASDVLDSAVKKATEVHGKLDPDKSKSTLGGKIGEIEDAKNNIISANSQLKTQVDSLSNWISTAEDIRQKAQQKAEEAYSKLDVHAELSKNVNKIVDANKRIKGVNQSLNTVHGNLDKWNEQAKRVLQGAIGKAQDVYDALEDKSKPLGENIDKIDSARSQIKIANDSLGENVKSLEHWKTAAEKIVQAGQKKCEEILKRVDETSNENRQVEIKKQAEALQKKAENLLSAYAAAYPKVQHLVEDVKNAVKDLEKGMKSDLVDLQQSIISKMKTHVGGMLGEIKSSVESIKGKAGNIAPNSQWTEQGSGLEGINTKVQKYFKAFSEKWPFDRIVGGWIDDILQHNGVVKRLLGWKSRPAEELKKELENSGIGGSIKSPLEKEINAAVEVFTSGQSTATDSIKDKITQVKRACELFAKRLDEKLKEEFQSGVIALAVKAKEAMKNVDDKEPSKQSHLKSIIAKANCTCYCGKCSSGGRGIDKCLECTDPKCILTQAVATTLLAVSSVGRQVSKELHSVFLSPENGNIASFLDKAKEVTDELHENLGAAQAATKPGPQPPTSSSRDNNEILKKVNEIERKV